MFYEERTVVEIVKKKADQNTNTKGCPSNSALFHLKI